MCTGSTLLVGPYAIDAVAPRRCTLSAMCAIVFMPAVFRATRHAACTGGRAWLRTGFYPERAIEAPVEFDGDAVVHSVTLHFTGREVVD